MSFTLNNKEYYKADYVKEQNSAFFYGTARSIRIIITKKNIPVEHYAYATYSKRENKWTLSDEKINKASLLLTREWVEQNVPDWKRDGIVTNQQKLTLENAPPLLQLNDVEKIKDENGNIVEIETRGVKTIDGIYFYGKDIERILKMVDIRGILNNETTTYKVNNHYKKFIRNDKCNTSDIHNKLNQETIYLTYRGLVKMLMTRQHPIAETFQEWAFKTLFTVQIGSKEEKQELSSKLLGCDISDVRSFLNCGVTEYSELYLVCIGKISDLSREIPELVSKNQNDLLFKYGYTSNLYKRLQTHKNYFSKYNGSNVSLVLHCPIDKQYLSQAEVELKQSFQTFDYILEHPEHKELVYFNQSKLSQFEKIFKVICEKYAGNCKKLQEQLEQFNKEKENEMREKEHEIREIKLQHQLELKEKEYKLKEYEYQLKEKEYQLKEKEQYNRELQLKLQHEQELKNIEKQFKEHLLSLSQRS